MAEPLRLHGVSRIRDQVDQCQLQLRLVGAAPQRLAAKSKETLTPDPAACRSSPARLAMRALTSTSSRRNARSLANVSIWSMSFAPLDTACLPTATASRTLRFSVSRAQVQAVDHAQQVGEVVGGAAGQPAERLELVALDLPLPPPRLERVVAHEHRGQQGHQQQQAGRPRR